ncbi:MAG TPA: UDP-2,3-diacylglucosamine diphosphatase [Candidatus Saccharimonadia bacterium]|nr:UDP-2,3-diacylglucosamine diphosphatase [Candidatus Saccharimonadia bacterium]
MTTLFIADLHLDESRPAIVESFLEFLAHDARRSDALYILGDLFETWIGDDDDAPLAGTVADALAALGRSGVPISFLHGNRDFLLGENYARRCGMALLPEHVVLDIEGRPTLVMHGDTLCTDDVEYVRFRSQSRDPAWQRAVLSGTLPERRALAQQARNESERHTRSAIPTIMDVAPAAVEAMLERSGVTRLIHGHTHRRAMHALPRARGDAERVVLGDWYERGSALVVAGPELRFVDV